MGENEYDRAYNCWASYAALDIVDDELVKSSTGVTSICASHVLGGKEHENKHLHKQLEELLAKLYEYQNLSKKSLERCSGALEDVVLRGLSNISEDKVLAVVNRVDWRVDHPDDVIWDVPNISVERFCQVD
ncbi:uncharacterized protein FPOAC1_013420 [Fusarium poae]|uniref:uncharacterized protein n=1 Tax=Fusarium poae TaxID=36050 RepID=UPI001D05302D|nr:uncharacterized protein FPOAC1_013420 [Fusarium poae]KAG8664640.1 hypothetical protein FPOAC1_013420 [Fusarium poae]